MTEPENGVSEDSVVDGSTEVGSRVDTPTNPMRLVFATLAFLVPIIVAVIVVLALAGRSGHDSGSASGTVWSFVVPAGTRAKADKGQYVPDIVPEQLTVSVGDTVSIRNEDSAVHTVGPFTVRPGETQKMTFTERGYFFGVCTVGGHATVTITVR